MSLYSDQPFAAEPKPEAMPPQPKRSWLPACLAGCLAIGLLSVLICGGVGWYVARNFKRIASDVGRQAIVGGIEQSQLDPAEKQAVIAQVDRVVDQFRSGQITVEDLARILDELAKSPVMQSIVISAVESAYIEPSGLTAEEKQAAHLTLQRVLRGVFEQKIKEGDLDAALAHVSTKTPGGQPQLKSKVTDDELRRFLAECQRVADQAAVPAEPFEVKISEEFRRAVDRALQPPQPPAPTGG